MDQWRLIIEHDGGKAEHRIIVWGFKESGQAKGKNALKG